MNLKTFLDNQEDKLALFKILNNFAFRIQSAAERTDIMKVADIEQQTYQQIRFVDNPSSFTTSILANFQDYKLDERDNYYYPMGKLLEYLLVYCEWNENEQKLFNTLIDQSRQKIKALTLRQAVGRIESFPSTKSDNGIGTGILISPNLVLTCNHIFTKNPIKQAWIRFSYYPEINYNLPIDLFELDLQFIKQSTYLDYVLVKIKGNTKRKGLTPVDIILNSRQNIRIIHHPLGEKTKVSKLGEVVQVGKNYIDHNINTNEGSSGAPIFDQDWQLVAIHQGHLGIVMGRNISPEVTSGIPICAFFPEIQTYLS